MNQGQKLIFHHSPHTRSTGVLNLLKELNADYDLHVINMKQGEQLKPDYLAVNPMGKVPAIQEGISLITEQAAVYIYLADRFHQAKLAPAIDDPLRGPYLRWMVFYNSCFEPAIIDRSQKREAAPRAMSPYGEFDTMFNTLLTQMSQGDYLLGNRFTAVDVLWGTALSWITRFQLIPSVPVITQYVNRMTSRPAYIWTQQKDQELAAKFA